MLDKDEIFYLRSTGNLSTGGTAIDMTDEVHPDNREMAQRAAKAIGLDVAGVDYITPDVTKSYREIGGYLRGECSTGLSDARCTSEGKPRDVAGPLWISFSRCSSRIPIAAVTGTTAKTTCTNDCPYS